MNRMASIELAINNEKAEMAFYNNESERSRNPVAKQLFRTLAGEEEEHMTRIQKLHDRLVADGSWPREVPTPISD